jgi:hypothetical protein
MGVSAWNAARSLPLPGRSTRHVRSPNQGALLGSHRPAGNDGRRSDQVKRPVGVPVDVDSLTSSRCPGSPQQCRGFVRLSPVASLGTSASLTVRRCGLWKAPRAGAGRGFGPMPLGSMKTYGFMLKALRFKRTLGNLGVAVVFVEKNNGFRYRRVLPRLRTALPAGRRPRPRGAVGGGRAGQLGAQRLRAGGQPLRVPVGHHSSSRGRRRWPCRRCPAR